MKLFQNDHLYTINNKEMRDAAASKDGPAKDLRPNLKLFDSSIFQPKIDLKNNPLSWRTKFGFSLGHFFNDAVSFLKEQNSCLPRLFFLLTQKNLPGFQRLVLLLAALL